jgi:hypothetical protein
MPGLIERRSDRRYIDHGRVHCPMRMRAVDVDVCVDCCWLRDVRRGEGASYVRCRPGFLAEETSQLSRQF